MSYPPVAPPNDRLNTTPMVDNHPSDHNVLADAITDVVITLGADPAGSDSDVQERLDRMEAELAPVGQVISHAGNAAPPGRWLLCNGDAINRTTYAALFGVIGTEWGNGNGSTTFRLPDLEGRGLVGAAGDAAKSVGDRFGDTDTPLPAHKHTVDAHNHTSAAHSHGLVAASVTQGGTGVKIYDMEQIANVGGWPTSGDINPGYLWGADQVAPGFSRLHHGTSFWDNGVITLDVGGNTDSKTPGVTGNKSPDTDTQGVTATNNNFHPSGTVKWYVRY